MFNRHIGECPNIGRVSGQSDGKRDSQHPFHFVELTYSVSDAWIDQNLGEHISVANFVDLIVPQCEGFHK